MEYVVGTVVGAYSFAMLWVAVDVAVYFGRRWFR